MIFTAQTQRAIRNKGMAAVYGIAAEFDCEPGDVLDLLVTTSFTETSIPVSTPSQPNPPPSAVQTDGEGPSSSRPTAPSVDHYALDTADLDRSRVHLANCIMNCGTRIYEGDDHLVVPPNDEFYCAACAATEFPPSPLPGDPADGADIPPNRVSAPSAAFSPAPKRTHTKGRGKLVEASIREHPDWTDQMHAAALGVDPAYVRRTATRLDLTLTSRLAVRKAQQDATTEALRAATEKPKEPEDRAEPPTPRSEPKSQPAATYAGAKRPSVKHRVANLYSMHPDWDAHRMAKELGANLGTVQTALSDARAAAGESLKEPVPPANPQKPVAPPPTGERRTLTERIRKLHQQHPNLTAALIAKELGANVNSVSTILSTVRGKVAPAKAEPEFTGRRAMIEHYGEIAKRLGKPR